MDAFAVVGSRVVVRVPRLVAAGPSPVFRFTRAEVRAFLDRLGAKSYAIETARFLQAPPLLALSKLVPGRLPLLLFKALLRIVNAIGGRWGNAFCVVVER